MQLAVQHSHAYAVTGLETTHALVSNKPRQLDKTTPTKAFFSFFMATYSVTKEFGNFARASRNT